MKSSYRNKPNKEIRRSKNNSRKQNLEETEYIFTDNPSDDCDESNINLTSRRPDKFVEKVLQSGDTLQSLSLDFNCPISELKRLNKIHKDNEIYALRIVKIPVTPGSLVLEKINNANDSSESDNLIDFEAACSCSSVIPELTSSNTLKTDLLVDSVENLPEASSIDYITNKIGIHHGLVPVSDSLISVDGSFNSALSKNVSANFVSSANLDNESQQHLLEPEENIPGEGVEQSRFSLSCSGADWGLSWIHLVICTLILAFACPIIYIVYIAERVHSS